MANTIVDAQTRVELYKHAEEFIIKEGGVIIPLFIHMVAVLKNNCHGCKRHIRVY